MTPDLLTADLLNADRLAHDRLVADILELPVAYRDTSAADLILTLDLPPQEALAARTVFAHGWTVELRILGASHQVLVSRGDHPLCSETVACRVDDQAAKASLASRHHQWGPVADHHFTSRSLRLGRGAFDGRVDALLATLAGSAVGLCGRFPGDERATTGLRLASVNSSELRWCGWHSYPGTTEVVTTASRLVLHGVTSGSDGRVGRQL